MVAADWMDLQMLAWTDCKKQKNPPGDCGCEKDRQIVGESPHAAVKCMGLFVEVEYITDMEKLLHRFGG